MRLGSFAWAVVVLVAGSVWAAPGDPLVVTGDAVNVRFEPSTGGRIMTRLYRDEEVVEVAREGDWVRAELPDSGGREGWIHGSLLAPRGGERLAAPPPAQQEQKLQSAQETLEEAQRNQTAALPTARPAAPDPGTAAATPDAATTADRPQPSAAIEPAAGPSALGPDVQRFKESVEYLNSRALQVAGVDLFTDVRPVDAATVEVVTTDAWSTVPPAGQRSYLNTLVDRWAAAKGGDGPVSVQIIDPTGSMIAEKTGP